MESKKVYRRKAKRLLALLLSLGLISAAGASALYAETEAGSWETLSSALSGTTAASISLTPEESITASGTFEIGASHTLDLNGKGLVQNGKGFNFSAEGLNLTIKDSVSQNGSVFNFTSLKTVSGSQKGTITLDGVQNSLTDSFSLENVNLTLNNAAGFYVTVDETAETDADGNVTYTIKDSSSGKAVLGTTASDSSFALKIQNGSTFGVYAAQSDKTVGGALTVNFRNGDSIVVDSAANAQSNLYAANSTKVTLSGSSSEEGSAGISVLNGSTASLGDLSVNAASNQTAVFLVDGKNKFTVSSVDPSTNGTTSQEMEFNSSLTANAFTQTGSGTVQFKIQNGGEFYLNDDLTLDENTILAKDANSSAGAVLSLTGDLVSKQDLFVGTAAESLVQTIQADSLEMANQDLKIEKSGYVGAAKVSLTNANVTVAGGSQLIGTESIDIQMKDGNSISVTDGSNLFAGDSSTSKIGNLNITLAKDASAVIEAKGLSQVYATGTNTIKAEAGATLTLNAGGTENTENRVTLVSSEQGTTVGGPGTVNLNFGNYSVLGSCAGMVLGDTDGGTVNFNISGANSYAMIGLGTSKEESLGKLAIAEAGTVNVKISDGSFVQALTEVRIATSKDAQANIEINGGSLIASPHAVSGQELAAADMTIAEKGSASVTFKNNGTMRSSGAMIVGQDGAASISGNGNLLAGGKLVVGQKANETASTVNLTDGYVEAAGLVVAEAEGSNASLSLTGGKSVLHILASKETLSAAGNGSITIKDVTSTDFSSCVYLEAGAQIFAKNGISLDNSYMYLGSDSVLNASEGGIKFTNGSIVNGYDGGLKANGDVSFSGSTYILGITTNGSSNAIKVTNGALSIENSKLEVNFTDNGAITAGEWTVANVESEDESDKITGEWEIAGPLEFYDFAQKISEDGKTQTISMQLNTDYFNGRANSLQLARQSLWNAVEDRIAWNVDDVVYCGQKSPFYNYEERISFWSKMGYRGMDVKGSKGYDLDAFNLTVGADCVFEEYFAAGAFFNYSNPELKGDHEFASADNYSFGIYGGYKTWGGFELKGTLAFTFTDYELNRQMGSLGNANTDFYGSALTASIEIARPFYFGRFVLRPLFAVDTECVWQEEATETGAYAMCYDKTDDTWTHARLGSKLEWAVTERFILRGKAFYAIQMDDQGPSKTNAYFRGSSERMEFVGADVGDDYFNVGLSAAFMYTQNFSFFANYDGYFADESNSHFGHCGFQVNF